MSAIMRYLTGPDTPESLAHATAEAIQSRGMSRLEAALTDSLNCAECRLQLPAFALAVDMDETGTLLNTEHVEVARHLQHCQECASIFAELQAFSQFGDEINLPASDVPVPDLSFLPPSARVDLSLLWRQIENARRELITEIKVTVSQAAVLFGTLPAELIPQPVPVPVLRDPATRTAGQRLSLPDRDHHLSIELTISPAGGKARLALGVFITAADATVLQPVPLATITLLNAEGKRLRRVNTGHDGQAAFSDLSPGRYEIQVRTDQGQWEVALNLQ